jgi:hypothetical protein
VRGHHAWVPSSPYWPRWPVSGRLSPARADPRFPLASRCCSRCPPWLLAPLRHGCLSWQSRCRGRRVALARGQRGVVSASWPADRSTVHVSHPVCASSCYRSEVTRPLTSPSSYAALFASPRWSAAVGGAASDKNCLRAVLRCPVPSRRPHLDPGCSPPSSNFGVCRHQAFRPSSTAFLNCWRAMFLESICKHPQCRPRLPCTPRTTPVTVCLLAVVSAGVPPQCAA